MRVKTFRGKSTKAVLDQVKRELGPEAVILSSQSKRENGVCFCEVMAAVEQEEAPASSPASGAGGETPGQFGSDEVMSFKREWSQIKDVLLGLAGDRIDLSVLSPRQQQGLRFLEEDGVRRDVIIRLFARLSCDAECSLLGALGGLVPVRGLTPNAFPQKLQAVSGPSGVGKTTQLVRMAMAFQKSRPGARVCLVNADCDRGQGRLVLKHYAQLSGLTYRELHGPDDAQDMLGSMDKYDRVLIDLPATPRGGRLAETLAGLGLDGIEGLAVHLLLSPHYAAGQLAAFLDAYRSRKTVSLIWTKLDEACTFGEIVNAAVTSGLPASALVKGPGLRDALALTDEMALWKLLFKHELPTSRADAAQARPARAKGRAAA